MLKDPRLEARAEAIGNNLRGLVCQNESIEASGADLAHQLRVLVRQRLKEGDTDQQVIDYLVSRYGEFVLLKPVFAWHTLALWGAAPAVIVIGAITLIVLARRRRPVPPAELTAEEAEALERLRDGEAPAE
jgi:cytochrome c-type biogenesis protein CcmH